VDIILSYSHLNLQNSTLVNFVRPLIERAHVKQLITASPFNMGLLTNAPPVPWHPASAELKAAVLKAGETARPWPGGLPNLALGYAIRESKVFDLPLVAGFSVAREVHECVAVWREIQAGVNSEPREEMEKKVLSVFEESGHYNESWASP
jgi:D-arabinose 1-dehydrogenase